jgi:hypothetical protein
MTLFKDKLKAIVGMPHKNRYFLTAEEAHLKTETGIQVIRDRLVSEKVESLSLRIKVEAADGNYVLVDRIGSGYDDILDDVIDYFREGGYIVKILDRNIIPEFDKLSYLMITWKNEELPSKRP